MKLSLVLALFAAIFLVSSGHWRWRHSGIHHGGWLHGRWRHGGWHNGGSHHWRWCQNRMKCLTEQRKKLKNELDQCLSRPPPSATSPTTTTTSPTTTTTSPTTTTTLPPPPPISDCWDVKTRQNQSSDGTYTIDSPAGGQVDVRCDMTTDNGGWLTFVRRVQGGVDFNRTWEEYKNGFGDLSGDFWWGNEFLHTFTAAKDVEMRVDMSDGKGNHAYALYDSLHVDDEANNYTIHFGQYSGNAGDSLRYYKDPMFMHNNKPFGTYDHEGYMESAKKYYSGFWFHISTTALPTGRYNATVYWPTWKGMKSLKEITMSIRPKGVV
ncbi:fibrinogen-like protein A isoform X2 [Gigantopelta aegis]|uniref:fibrinogen-like protein A isoform X2 n=1 Tax=Gigantopelta aegis TaxID=1735272 RepID=UPI001B888404|nr:fibrinogen-like protein A isoform X2 [Gigantopelta aegis]